MAGANFSQPTYNLSSIKKVLSSVDSLRMTGSSRATAFALGFEDQDIVDAIQSIQSTDFYKTMPSTAMPGSANHDVYKFSFKGIDIYAKFQNLNGFIVVSFKEL